jgi:hypothetical protein
MRAVRQQVASSPLAGWQKDARRMANTPAPGARGPSARRASAVRARLGRLGSGPAQSRASRSSSASGRDRLHPTSQKPSRLCQGVTDFHRQHEGDWSVRGLHVGGQDGPRRERLVGERPQAPKGHVPQDCPVGPDRRPDQRPDYGLVAATVARQGPALRGWGLLLPPAEHGHSRVQFTEQGAVGSDIVTSGGMPIVRWVGAGRLAHGIGRGKPSPARRCCHGPTRLTVGWTVPPH